MNYNNDFSKVETYISLKKIEKSFLKYGVTKIIFWDNIPLSSNIDIKKNLKNCEYIPSLENKGLSYIYNFIIKTYCKDNDYLILLDNDSIITESYFEKLEKNIKKYLGINLFVPVVKVNQKYYSPNKNICLFNFYFKKMNYGLCKSKGIFAINSGMCISGKYLFEEFKEYDKRLKFYGTDNYFMNKYSQQNFEMVIFDYIMVHKLSAFDSKEHIEKKIWRFNDQINAIKILALDKNILIKILYYVYIYMISLKKAVQYRNLRFIRKIKRG